MEHPSCALALLCAPLCANCVPALASLLFSLCAQANSKLRIGSGRARYAALWLARRAPVCRASRRRLALTESLLRPLARPPPPPTARPRRGPAGALRRSLRLAWRRHSPTRPKPGPPPRAPTVRQGRRAASGAPPHRARAHTHTHTPHHTLDKASQARYGGGGGDDDDRSPKHFCKSLLCNCIV